jgi:hypothetical protein
MNKILKYLIAGIIGIVVIFMVFVGIAAYNIKFSQRAQAINKCLIEKVAKPSCDRLGGNLTYSSYAARTYRCNFTGKDSELTFFNEEIYMCENEQ